VNADAGGADARLVAGWSALERRDLRSAEDLARAALLEDPTQIEFVRLLAASLFMQDRFGEALEPFREVFDKARTSGAGYHLGYCYLAVNDPGRAGEVLEQVVREYPQMAPAHNLLGISLVQQSRYRDALAHFAAAIEHAPQLAEAHLNMGSALSQLGRRAEAVEHFRRAIELDPGSAVAHHNLGMALQDLSRHDDAIGPLREALKLDPQHQYTLGALLWSKRLTCDWEGLEAATAAARAGVRRGWALIEPLALVAVSQDPHEQLLCARRFCEDRVKAGRTPAWAERRDRSGKIRVAYLSADFREHAVAYCTAELFRLHDRSRFEVLGVSYGVDDGSAMRAALARSFDRFVDVREQDDARAAGTIAELQADIAVDLTGYTRGCRPGILARRPAPVQVEYLGFPGTSGTDFIDYLIADRFVIPEEDRRHYSEEVVYLPDSYMVNPSERLMAGPPPRRADAGLPERGFVFCSFNNSYKITPEVFDVWMRLLSRVEGSVLWLARDNAAAEANLRREAARRGVDPARLVFAPFVKRIEEHYARLPLGDLVLDTAYNGHLTTADALWAGLPVLTWAGTAFAGRVAGSLLRAVGLSDLVARDLAEYEARALELASDDRRLAGLREKLRENRRSSPLFDTDRFRRHIESAYARMWEIRQRGETPRSFSVPA
jgi:predicted O-linked N-acetylglucosamine transferase (SPINDLY family)